MNVALVLYPQFFTASFLVSAASQLIDSKQSLMLDTKLALVNGNVEQPSLPATTQPTPIPGMVPSQPTTNTLENSLPIAATAEDVKERGPPKALIHPQVLTHVIEDFVIQESSEPFPITRNSLLSDLKPTSTDKEDEQSRKSTVFLSMMFNLSKFHYPKMRMPQNVALFILNVLGMDMSEATSTKLCF